MFQTQLSREAFSESRSVVYCVNPVTEINKTNRTLEVLNTLSLQWLTAT